MIKYIGRIGPLKKKSISMLKIQAGGGGLWGTAEEGEDAQKRS